MKKVFDFIGTGILVLAIGYIFILSMTILAIAQGDPNVQHTAFWDKQILFVVNLLS